MKKSKLIVLGGFAGAGKTTIGRKVASEFNYPIFSSDEFNAALRPLLHKSFHEVSPTAYDTMWHIIKKNLQSHVTCILDANMCNAYTWKVLDEVKREFRETVDVVPIILVCSLETHKERIQHRGETDSEHLNLGGDDMEDGDVMKKYEFINSLDRADLVRISAEGPIDEVYEKVLQVVR